MASPAGTAFLSRRGRSRAPGGLAPRRRAGFPPDRPGASPIERRTNGLRVVTPSGPPDGRGPIVVTTLVALLPALAALFLLPLLAQFLALLGGEPLAGPLFRGEELGPGVERPGAAQAGHGPDLVEHAHLGH